MTNRNKQSDIKPIPIIIIGIIIIAILFMCNRPSEEDIAIEKENIKTQLYIKQIEASKKAKIDSISKVPIETKIKEVYRLINTKRESNTYLKNKVIELFKPSENTKFLKPLTKTYDSLVKLELVDIEKKEISHRKEMEPELRNIFLDAGLDIEVKVSGRKMDKLTLTYVLFNDVWLRKFEKEGWFNTLHNKGYNEINMTDGYRYSKGFTWN